ncbi:MAG TPA: hypothetical protein VII99_05615 [Bacteroidia bacterium]
MKKIFLNIFFLSVVFTGYLTAQNIQIKGFTNVDASAIFDSSSYKNHFALGQYDLFITSKITEKVSFLGETVFEYKNSFQVGVERAIINYHFKDYCFLTVGKQYTPIGYWNNAYHHGLVLQPTINRPNIVKEDFGGDWLPLEDVAVQLNGEGITKMNLGYNLMVGNGIASTPVDDFNESKAVCLNLHAEPVDNLKFYVSGYDDNVPAGTTTLQGIQVAHKSNLLISNASVAYTNGKLPVEFIAEYYNLRTQMLDSSFTASSNGFLIYAGYKFKKLKFVPYTVYDGVMLDKNEKYFTQYNTSSLTVGLRYIIHPLSVIKLELKDMYTKEFGTQYRIDLQFAVGF